MKTVGAYEAKTHFSSMLEKVEHGEVFLITKHGQPVAKLTSIKPDKNKLVQRAIQRLKVLVEAQELGDLDWKSLRDEGRR